MLMDVSVFCLTHKDTFYDIIIIYIITNNIISIGQDLALWFVVLTYMEVKVVIKEVKHRTAACIACRKRKRKCEGRSPCAHCATHNIPSYFANTTLHIHETIKYFTWK